MENSVYRELVLDIYQSVPEPSHWPVVLDRICNQFLARGCIIFEWQLFGRDRQLVTPWFTSGYEPDILQDYLRRNRIWEEKDQDIYERQLLSIDGIEVISEEVLYADETDYLTRPHVKELRDYGIRHRTGSLLDKDNPFRSRFSLQLSEGRGMLTPKQRSDLADLLPHVAKAMDVGRPIASPGFEKRALLSILDQLEVGICLLDPSGRVALTNTEFDRQRENYGAFQTTRNGSLRLHPRADQGRFSQLTYDALNHGQCGARPRKEAIAIPDEDGAGVLCVEIVPFHRSEEIGSQPFDGAILFSRDTTRPVAIDVDLVRQVFSNLTGAELAVIDLICQGLTNSEIAERRHTIGRDG